MVDTKEIKTLIRGRILPYERYEEFMENFIKPCMKALGEDENDIIEFLRSADVETLDWISSFTEVLYAKFPSNEMGKVIDEIFEPIAGFTVNKD